MSAQKPAGESQLADLVTIYELPYAIVKEAVFHLYLWGLQTDNDDAIDLYKRFLDEFREWDDKFVRAEYKKQDHETES
ncbi:MAG: hypothetical protein OXE46_11290 [Chloroflexi bacterium]|nr:hypothetical protein [Chloroflexota bacterium]